MLYIQCIAEVPAISLVVVVNVVRGMRDFVLSLPATTPFRRAMRAIVVAVNNNLVFVVNEGFRNAMLRGEAVMIRHVLEAYLAWIVVIGVEAWLWLYQTPMPNRTWMEHHILTNRETDATVAEWGLDGAYR
ncbi:hypothetical protein SCHPADRAFT_896960 [Schizopora paradoxa]|uniref:Uncharacterized protein n=1 Tax=Schizopora paradoxa TaxID=27342 RepID=A0A0H2R4Z7_9AGAM|nr:hypothetical protein SCHPADRAFT_896960 [Schizopora paradoxa]